MKANSQSSCYSKSKLFDKEVNKITRFSDKAKLNQMKALMTKLEHLENEYTKEKSDLRAKQAVIESKQINWINQIVSEKIHDSNQENQNSTSVPVFWMKCMEGSCRFDFAIIKSDKLALKYLTGIFLIDHPDGFSLKYCFSKNPFFSNRDLVIRYTVNNNFSIQKIDSDKIDWFSDETNLTIKREKDAFVPVANSFFNSFTSFSVNNNLFAESCFDGIEDFGDLFSNENDSIDVEFSFGLFMKNDFLPNSINYYLNSVIRANKSKNKSSKVEGDSLLSFDIDDNTNDDEALTTENVTQETLRICDTII